MKAAPHTELPEIHSFSITQYWPLIVILIPCLLVLFFLDTLHTHWCRLVCRNSVELNFVKTGLRSKFGVSPQFFSHEVCLYITRFIFRQRSSVRCACGGWVWDYFKMHNYNTCILLNTLFSFLHAESKLYSSFRGIRVSAWLSLFVQASKYRWWPSMDGLLYNSYQTYWYDSSTCYQPTAEKLQLYRKINTLFVLTNSSLQQQPFLHCKTGLVPRTHGLGT